jgi:integrase
LLKTHVFSTGYRIPVVYRAKDAVVPILLPLTYSILQIKGKAFKTRKRHQAAIDELYQFFEEKTIELDEALIEGQFYRLFDHLNEFFMIYLYRHQDRKPPSSEVYMIKVRSLKDYLLWTFSRYIQQQVADEKQTGIALNLKLKLTAAFESYEISSKFHRINYKSLSDQEAADLNQVVHPESEYNPFPVEHRLRNYLMVKIFLSTGIRLGELLLLKSISLVRGNQGFYLKIAYTPDEEDTRFDRPDLKNVNSERVVAITKEIFELCDHYILHLRSPIRKGKRMKLTHGFLFASELGKPLSKGTVADIFRKINTTLYTNNKQFSIRVSPHILRHTFADNFLQYLIDVRQLDMARAKDELRSVCGWSTKSVMPLHYAGRYINRIANQHNLERIKSTYTFYGQQPGL